MLTSGRGRLNGSAFAIGFVAGQSAFCALAIAVGSLSFPHRDAQHPTFQAILEVLVGVALLVAAVYLRKRLRHPGPTRPPNARAEAFKHRLSTLRPATALGTGAVLGIGGPKRIGITLVVVASIAAAGVSNAGELALTIFYVVVGTALVWVPVVLYIVFGHRASDQLTNAQHWISAHKDPLTFYPSLVLGPRPDRRRDRPDRQLINALRPPP